MRRIDYRRESTNMTASASFATSLVATFDRMIPGTLRADPRDLRAARNLTLLALITALSVPLLTMMYHFLGNDSAGMVVLTGGIVMMTAPFAMNAGLGLALARDLFIGALFVLKIWLAVHLGGLAAPTVPWFLLCPLIAVLLGGFRPGLVWSGLVLATVIALFVIERTSGPFVVYPVADQQVLVLVSVIGLVALSAIIGLCFRADFESALRQSE
jgi:hypothetical protein